MTTTPLDTVNATKQDHATAILFQMDQMVALIGSQPELWFGGLPPVFEELKRIVDHRSAAIRQAFALPQPEGGLNPA